MRKFEWNTESDSYLDPRGTSSQNLMTVLGQNYAGISNIGSVRFRIFWYNAELGLSTQLPIWARNWWLRVAQKIQTQSQKPCWRCIWNFESAIRRVSATRNDQLRVQTSAKPNSVLRVVGIESKKYFDNFCLLVISECRHNNVDNSHILTT